MDCAEEVSLLRARLSRVTGVRDLKFDVVSGRMEVEYSPSQTSAQAIQEAVASTGMRCEPWKGAAAKGLAADRRRLLAWVSGVALAAGLAVQVWLTGNAAETLLAHGHGAEGHSHHETHPIALALLLTALAAGAAPVLPKAAGSVRMRRADMNLLVVISLIGAAWLREWAEAATLSFLFALAGRLEQWSLGRAREAISELVAGTPAKVSVVHAGIHHGADGEGEHEHVVEQGEVAPGAVVRVRPGQRIAFDGVIVRGRSMVNQAFVTGESVPVEKREGQEVYAGTLNVSGSLDIRTTKAAADTMLARTIRMAGESSTRRGTSERFVEQFARIYTPCVMALAALVTIAPPLWKGEGWHDSVYQGMVILLIACPCALVISTPVCVVAGITAAARRQVLIKGGAVLEAAAKIGTLAVDKTSALLSGSPAVDQIIPLGGRDERQVLGALAALERGSEHPIAKAILREAEARGIYSSAAEDFSVSPGLAVVSAAGPEWQFWAGSPSRIDRRGAGAQDALQQASRLASGGLTVVAFGVSRGLDVEVWGLVALAQPLNPDARRHLAALARSGVDRVVLLTGDMPESAQAAASAAGIAEVHAGLGSADKTARLAALMGRRGGVAYVGDSVHDAEAMAGASVGIAMGPHAADVTRENAGVIILPQDLGRISLLIHFAKSTLRVIQQNVWLAVGAKFLFLAAALTGAATLWMAIAADMGATLVVTLNGLRLLRLPKHRID